MITVYGFSPSGNCHKVKLLLEQLGRRLDRDYRWIETNSAIGETRTPGYLAKNPNGKVPMIELDDGCVLVESNAILCWLADGTSFLPADPWQKAQALSWLFFEQYSHEPYIAVARFICGWTPADSPRCRCFGSAGMRRLRSWSDTSPRIPGSPAATTASPMSRSTRIPASHRTAASPSMLIPRFATGCRAWKPPPALCRCLHRNPPRRR